MIRTIALTCPNCGSALTVEDDRKFIYCEYCGTKVMLHDDSTQTIHTIDEAAIKRAENERYSQEMQVQQQERERKMRARFLVFWIATIMLCMALVIVGLVTDFEPLLFFFPVGFLIGAGGFIYLLHRKKMDMRRNPTDRTAKVNDLIASAQGRNAEKVRQELLLLGFTNINMIPLNDLPPLLMIRNGTVKGLSIDGEQELWEGQLFSENAKVTVTYHSPRG
jgi:hypothetical protein